MRIFPKPIITSVLQVSSKNGAATISKEGFLAHFSGYTRVELRYSGP